MNQIVSPFLPLVPNNVGRSTSPRVRAETAGPEESESKTEASGQENYPLPVRHDAGRRHSGSDRLHTADHGNNQTADATKGRTKRKTYRSGVITGTHSTLGGI